MIILGVGTFQFAFLESASSGTGSCIELGSQTAVSNRGYRLHRPVGKLGNPPTPSAVERVGANSKLILSILGIPESQVLGQGVPYHIHLRHSGSPKQPAQQKSTKSRKWLDFGTNGTPEALDERNPYSATSRSHWEGSRTLERGPGPQKWGRRHGEAF